MEKIMRNGLLLALLAALISGISVFVNGAAVKLADPFVYTALKNIGALVFLGAVMLAFAEIRHFRSLSKKQWGLLALIGVIGGSLPFLMFFWGLKLGGAAVSSFIFRSLFIFAGVFGYFLMKEKPEAKDVGAGFAILIGNALLVSGDMAFGFGQLLVLGATILWALEYTVSRMALSDIHPRAVMVSRMLFGSIVLLGFLAMSGSLGAFTLLNTESFAWLAVTSLLLGGFLIAWYTSLKYLPVLKATAILSLGGVVTAGLDYAFAGKILSPAEGFGLLFIVAGVSLAAGSAELLSALMTKKSPGLVG